MWKKWVVIGASAGISLAVVSALMVAALAEWWSRPLPWNTDALSVVWSEAVPVTPAGRGRPATWDDLARYRAGQPLRPPTAEEIAQRDALPDYEGFVLTFAVQNNTDYDVTIPGGGVRIMSRRSREGVLAESPPFVQKLEKSFFIPARQKGEFSFRVNWPCFNSDPSVCLGWVFDGLDALVLFYDTERIEVDLPKPPLRQERVKPPA